MSEASVFSFDYDKHSVSSTQFLKNKFFQNDDDWHIEQGSVLDKDYMRNIGKFDITGYPVYERARIGLGYLPQEMSVFKGLYIEDNLLSIIETKEFDNHKRYQILEDLLVEFNITKIRSSLGITLSGGERRRVEIARCIASNPTHILLDEPFSGIDPIAIQDLKNLIEYLKQRKIGVLITDHNVKDTLDIVDRAYVLYDGKILLKGNPFEIKNDQKVKSVYLGKSFSI